jgi:5-methylcytosine-specific restriction endonuclease McrA
VSLIVQHKPYVPTRQERQKRIDRIRRDRRLRIALYDAQGGECFYCGIEMLLTAKPPLSCAVTLDEKIPQCKGGRRDALNAVAACFTCNRSKKAMTAEEFLASPQLVSIKKGQRERERARDRASAHQTD